MSRKDYQKFAEMFAESKDVMQAILGAAKIFHYDNPNFRPYQFFIACGIDEISAADMVNRI